MNPVSPCVFIIDDDDAVRDAMSMLLDTANVPYTAFASASDFFEAYDGTQRGCLVLDIRMPGISGLELQAKLNARGAVLPIIFITGHGDVPMAVEAMRQGALNFLRKPIDESELLASIQQAFEQESGLHTQKSNRDASIARFESLTQREREVFACVARGLANKAIATDLGISERTVEVHRAQVMKKLGAKTLADLVRAQISLEY